MIRFRKICRYLALPMAAMMLWSSVLPTVAQAALVTTEQAVGVAEPGSDRARVLEFLSRGDVRGQMESLGIAAGEAEERVAALSDAEVANIAGKLDAMPAGQDALTAAISAVLLILLVLLVTDLLGFTDVYPFTRKGSAR